MKKSYPKLHSLRWKEGYLADNVVDISPDTPATPLSVLQGAASAMLYEIVLIGYTPEGMEYIAGTTKDPARAAYMFARAQLNMLRVADGE